MMPTAARQWAETHASYYRLAWAQQWLVPIQQTVVGAPRAYFVALLVALPLPDALS